MKAPLQSVRYIRHLPPKMVLGKLRHTITNRLLVPNAARATPPCDYDWNSAFQNPKLAGFGAHYRVEGDRFKANCKKLLHGEFVSGGLSHSFGSADAVRWGASASLTPKDSRWQHDLAFFLFAIPLISNDPETGIPAIAAMVRALEKQLTEDPSELRRFHWSPIAIAARTLALTSALALAPQAALREHHDSVAAIGGHVWRSAEILKLTVERYLGFNHAAATETGLAVALLVQGRASAAQRSMANLVRTFECSTTSDGMWAERSPAYHVHMLVLVDAVKSMHDARSPGYQRLDALSRRMRFALTAVVHPDGEIATFNDAAIGDAPPPAVIGWSLAETPNSIVLPAAGYARICQANTVVIMDAGPMGPDAVIGHGHADFLSIEVSIGKRRLIVDPGVASVSSDSDRVWTRSAASHNGPTLSGCEPAEFFGAWGVGRRGTAWFNDATTTSSGAVSLSGECDGYLTWGVTVGRQIVVERDGRVTIEDQWTGPESRERLISFLVPAEWVIERDSAARLQITHSDGTAVFLILRGGTVASIERSRSFREGPTREEGANRITITPSDSVVTTEINTCSIPSFTRSGR